MLDGRRTEARADVRDQSGARAAIVPQHANFDQFMAAQVDIDFMQHGRAEPRIADHHDGMQVVRARLERAAFCGIECDHRASLTGRAAIAGGGRAD